MVFFSSKIKIEVVFSNVIKQHNWKEREKIRDWERNGYNFKKLRKLPQTNKPVFASCVPRPCLDCSMAKDVYQTYLCKQDSGMQIAG
jgi:hypothetical protein